MHITEKLANFIVNTPWDDIPTRGIKIAKEAMLDCLGCIFTGAVQPAGKIITQYIREMGARPVCSVVGQGVRTSPPLASLANGIMAHAEDYDDISLVVLGHPSAPIFPAILAAGELCRASGRAIIGAYIIGFEVAARVGATLGPDHYSRGWHGTSTTGTLAAAAGSARLLGLDAGQARMALAIAASQTSGLRENFGTMTKPFHAGNAARSGVLSALLAKKGFTAALNIIEAPLGFLNVFKGERLLQPVEKIADKLGEVFAIEKFGIAFKPYPSCGETHAGIEIIRSMRKEHNISPKDIKGIECVFNEIMNSVMLHHDPKTGLEGKFSIGYCVARALLDGSVGLEDFIDTRINQPEVRDIINKIRIHIDPALPMLSTTINLELADGRRLSRHLDKPRGSPENPLSHEDLLAKYQDCAGLVLSDEDVDQSLELMENLENIKEISQLMDIIVRVRDIKI